MWPPSQSFPGAPAWPGSHSAAASPTAGATSLALQVAAGTPVVTVPAHPYGVGWTVYDPSLLDATSIANAAAAGVSRVLFPVDSGDQYIRSTQGYSAGFTDPYGRTSPPAGNTYTALRTACSGVLPAGFDMMPTVNLASNAAATGGGSTGEAAAWVTDALTTQGFALAQFTNWRIGSEEFYNGYYPAPYNLGAATTHYSPLDPASVARSYNAMAAAMKAVNGSIKTGVVVFADGLYSTTPFPQWAAGLGSATTWNPTLFAHLSAAAVDFLVVHLYPFGVINDAGVLLFPALVARMVSTLRAQLSAAGLSPALPIIADEIASGSGGGPSKTTTSLTGALYTADMVLACLSAGIASCGIFQAHGGISVAGQATDPTLQGAWNYGDTGIFSLGQSVPASAGAYEWALGTPFPPYWALWLCGKMFSAGDAIVSTSLGGSGLATGSTVSAYAVLSAGGKLRILVLNKSATPLAVPITISGFTPAGTGTRYRYESADTRSFTAPRTTALSGMTRIYTVALPPYGLLLDALD